LKAVHHVSVSTRLVPASRRFQLGVDRVKLRRRTECVTATTTFSSTPSNTAANQAVTAQAEIESKV
jgi:hypothetical protein